ncbi:hypothetical protein ACA910_007003 [Epithemia clementina (nom. ined.)]
MKISSDLETRVALIGYVSVGKTTILNALLKDNFSQVSMKRTTAGINIFRIASKTTNNPTDDAGKDSLSWTPEEYRSAESTLEETVKDNQILRQSNTVHEKTFDIVLEEDFFEMRKDTKFVLVDVPGINEAGASDKYTDYVSTNWHTFDCVIVVLDGRQGVNTVEQVKLLEFVKTQCDQSKKLPVIILLNKIDDLAFEKEHQALVKETTEAIESLFQVTDCASALREIVADKVGSPATVMATHLPIVIPMSARHAYIYRVASTLGLNEFREKVDETFVDILGRDFYGRQWKTFNPQQKYEKAHQVIQDKKQYEEGIEESKFTTFLKALSFCVGGKETQEWLLEEQIKSYQERLDSDLKYVDALRGIRDRSQKLGICIFSVDLKFLELHNTSVENAFKKFTDPKNVHHLAKPMEEVFAYLDLVQHMGTLDEYHATTILGTGQRIVLRQLEVVLLTHATDWKGSRLTSYDWIFITSAVLGSAENLFFEEHGFGIPRVLLEKKFQESISHPSSPNKVKETALCPECNVNADHYRNAICCNRCKTSYVAPGESFNRSCISCERNYGGYGHAYYVSSSAVQGRCSNCSWKIKRNAKILKDPLKYKLKDNRFVPADRNAYSMQIHVTHGESPADPNHFGHLIWQYRNLIQRVERSIGKK